MRKRHLVLLALAVTITAIAGYYFLNGIFIGQPMMVHRVSADYFLNGIFIGQPMMIQRIFPMMLMPGSFDAFSPIC